MNAALHPAKLDGKTERGYFCAHASATGGRIFRQVKKWRVFKIVRPLRVNVRVGFRQRVFFSRRLSQSSNTTFPSTYYAACRPASSFAAVLATPDLRILESTAVVVIATEIGVGQATDRIAFIVAVPYILRFVRSLDNTVVEQQFEATRPILAGRIRARGTELQRTAADLECLQAIRKRAGIRVFVVEAVDQSDSIV